MAQLSSASWSLVQTYEATLHLVESMEGGLTCRFELVQSL